MMGSRGNLQLILSAILTVIYPSVAQLNTPPSNTTARVGNQTRLICQVTDPSDNFHWTEYVTSSYGKTIFTSDSVPPTDPSYEIDGTYDLIIRDLELSDGGLYACATFAMDPPATASLIILETPSLTIPNLIENVQTQVYCSAAYGSQAPIDLAESHRPTLQVYVDGEDQHLESVLTPGHPPQDELPLLASILQMNFNYTPTLEHEGREIECRIATITPSARYSMFTILSIRFVVRNIQITPIKETYKIGEKINCTADGNPTPEIMWNPMDTPYPHSPGPVLTIMENMVGYNGYNQWKCIAQNTVELTEFIELEISFTVQNEAINGSAPSFNLHLSLPAAMLVVLWSMYY